MGGGKGETAAAVRNALSSGARAWKASARTNRRRSAVTRPLTQHMATSSDGTPIAAYELGSGSGIGSGSGTGSRRAVLLIHGYSQSHLCWSRQFAGPLPGRFRLAAMDLHGHGAAGQPLEPARYPDGKVRADDGAEAGERLG